MPTRNAGRSDAKFHKGDQVRVKHGVKDDEYPDLSIGGWVGKVVAVCSDGLYDVRWSKETLESIHPVYKQRCERDGLDFEQYRLGGDDLELDDGKPLVIEHPKQIVVRPLSPKDKDDRIRMVFGLTSDDPLPDVSDASLESYHAYLVKYLVFPFTAIHGAEYGHPESVKVIGLGDPKDGPMIDDTVGLLCDARTDGHVVTLPLEQLENAKGRPNGQLIDDYCYWFHNHG